jgi:membrane-associated phospholipid phosphatase
MQWIWFKGFRAFWIPFLAGYAALLLLILFLPKKDGFLGIQIPHSEWLNVMFSIITWLGDGLTCVLIVLLFLLFVSAGKGFCLLSAYLGGSAVVQFLKHVVFNEAPRPVKWLSMNNIIHEIPAGIDPHLWNSFPSGHSTTAATLCFFIATQVQSAGLRFFVGMVAIIAGYSRIYLYMHFPEDVLMGLTIGMLAIVPAWFYWKRFLDQTTISWMNKPLLKWKN